MQKSTNKMRTQWVNWNKVVKFKVYSIQCHITHHSISKHHLGHLDKWLLLVPTGSLGILRVYRRVHGRQSLTVIIIIIGDYRLFSYDNLTFFGNDF